MFPVRLLAVVGATFSMLIGSTAYAYCVATTCSNTPAHDNISNKGVVCDRVFSPDCGKIIFWNNPCFAYSMQENGSEHFDTEALRKAVRKAFDQWALPALCARDKSPGLKVHDWKDVACDQVQYNSNKGNANIIIFRDSGWMYDPVLPAITSVYYEPSSGEVLGADMEINTDPANFAFTLTEGDPDKWDLPSILLHEVGHFIGLAHSEDSSAVMYHTLPKGVSKRSLSQDDARAVCALYPPKEDTKCNPMPYHGFASECADMQPNSDCSVRTPMPDSPCQHATGWAAVCAALFVARQINRSKKDDTGSD